MTTKPNEASAPAPQGESSPALTSQPGPPEIQRSRNSNAVLKSGPLFISSKGIGWTSWKKRWFILTRTSLVFFRSDPSAAPLRNGEVNLTLGGIDLNNSGSVEVKPDKKLLTVLFPDGRDGRAFTLKAETMEDLYEWKTALESALTLAPTAVAPTGQNGVLRTDQDEAVNGTSDQQKDKLPVKSMVIGRPILLALEDIDGSPSFLEKALRFIETDGVKTEGILRQAADVEDVERRIREYEQGKTEFSTNEDAHIIADCIKYVLRELPSSPVPASCCNALLEAFRSDRNSRVNAMRNAVLETFPEPNRRLLQRILMMMQAVASNKDENRMSISAVAACMSPLLLRPLLAGDCEVENEHFDVAGDGSFQLLQAAAAANHAQAITITLLEEYDYIFGEGSVSPELFSDTEESGSESEGATDDYDDEEDDMYDEDDNEESGSEEPEGSDDEYEHSISETCSGDDNEDDTDHADDESYDDKHSEGSSPVSKLPEIEDNDEAILRSASASSRVSRPDFDNVQDTRHKEDNKNAASKVDNAGELQRDIPAKTSTTDEPFVESPSSIQKSTARTFGSTQSARRPRWGRTSAKKNLSMESIDFSLDDDDEIRKLEEMKAELQNRIAEEANGNAILQASLENRKKSLLQRRLALQREVDRLQEQLQKEKELRATIEAGLDVTDRFVAGNMDEETKAELEEIAIVEEHLTSLKQRVDNLGASRQQEPHDRNNQPQGAVLRSKSKDNDMKSRSHLEKSNRIKGQASNSSDGTDCDNSKRKHEASSSLNRNQNQPVHVSSSKSQQPLSVLTAIDNPVPRPLPSPSSSKVGSTTTSALSKLTNRLNFLKERRSQIANELQDMDKAVQSPNKAPKGKGSLESPPSNRNIDRNQRLEGTRWRQDSGRQQPITDQDGGGSENQSHEAGGNNKKASMGKSESLSVHSSEVVGRKSEGQSTQHLDRIKSESQTLRSEDKGRQSEGSQYYSSSRTSR